MAITSKPPDCEGCPLEALGQGFVPPEGSCRTSGVAFVAEAPGAEEVPESRPLVGQAGKTFDLILNRAKLDRRDYLISNAVWCRPPENSLAGEPYEREAVKHCTDKHLFPRLRETPPKVVIALGGVALKALTGLDGIEHWRGSVISTPHGVVVPTFHPSYIMRGKWHLATTMTTDIRRGLQVAAGTAKLIPLEYLIDPSWAVAKDWVDTYFDAGCPPLSFDIETLYKASSEDKLETAIEEDTSYKITRISFSYAKGKALTFMWTHPYIELAQRLLSSPGDKYSWNGDNFDIPRLEFNECPVLGKHYDMMIGWHVLQPSLPYNLQFATSNYWGADYQAWKHLYGPDQGRYACYDSDALHRCAEGVLRDLSSKGQLEMYEHHFVKVAAVLRRMGKRGVLVDNDLRRIRYKEFADEFSKTVNELNILVPTELRPTKKYKLKLETLKKKKFTEGKTFEDFDWIQEASGSWSQLEDWLPTYGKNVVDYFRYMKYPVPKNRKTKRPTSGEEAIEKLLQAHPDDEILEKTIYARKNKKAQGFLAETYLGKDGRFHSEFGFHPRTGRLSSRRPNLMQQPAMDRGSAVEQRVAQAVKSTIIAPEGYVILEADYKAQEALLLGYFAGDENYMRMARLGIYAYFIAGDLGITVDLGKTDAEIKPILNRIKTGHPSPYARMKKTILARGYGEGIAAIAMEFESEFLGPAAKAAEAAADLKKFRADHTRGQFIASETRRIQRAMAFSQANHYVHLYETVAPKVKAWQDDIRLKAHHAKKLTNPFGYSQHFYRVLVKEEDGSTGLGEEANEVLAFLPQSTGAFVLRRALLELDDLANDDFFPIIPIHDAIVCYVREDLLVQKASLLKEIMERPVPELGGLRIEVEMKAGRNWSEVKHLEAA